MGFELSFKAEMTGVAGTYLEGMKCEAEIEELCDDSTDCDGVDINMTTMLDTNQGDIAKQVLGYDNQLDKLCKVIHKALMDYPSKC